MTVFNVGTAGLESARVCTAVRTRRLMACVLLAMSSSAAVSACEVSATPISFGVIDPLSPAATDSASEIVVSCAESTAYTVALSSGGGSYFQRQMSSGSGVLDYQLFIDASRLTVWGDGSGGTLTVAGSAGSTGTTHYVYGRMPRQLLAIPGTYTDTLMITVTY